MTTKIFSAPIIAKTKNYIRTAYIAYINKKWYVSKSECSTKSTPSFGISDKNVTCPYLYELDDEHFVVGKRNELGEATVLPYAKEV